MISEGSSDNKDWSNDKDKKKTYFKYINIENVSGYVYHSSLRMGTRHCVLFRGSLWERLQRDRLPEAWLKTPNALGIGRWTPMMQANERLRA